MIKRVDSNWIEGKKGEKIGIFPISFVEVCCCYSLNLINIKFIFGKVEPWGGEFFKEKVKPLWIREWNNLWRLLKLHMNVCEKYSFSLYKQLNDAAKTLINSKASTNRYLHVLCIDLWLQQIINSFFKAFISLNICCGNINIPMQYMYFCFHLIIQTYSFCKKK